MALARNVVLPDVADDPRAKLMYYIKCITDVIQFRRQNALFERLKVYQAYIDVLGPMLEALEGLGLVFAPHIFLGKCVFIDNQFCATTGACPVILTRTTAIPTQFAASEGVQVDGTAYLVRKVMIVTSEWLENYYITPLMMITEMIIEQQRVQEQRRQESCACAIL